jgi:hypothetical protein
MCLFYLTVTYHTVPYRVLLGKFPGFGRGVSSNTLSGLKSLLGKYCAVWCGVRAVYVLDVRTGLKYSTV